MGEGVLCPAPAGDGARRAGGSRPCRIAAGQPPLPPEGATGQPGRTEQPAAEATTDGEWRVK